MTTNRIRVAAYVRVSTDRQDGERQRKAIEAWAKDRGHTITTWFEDVGFSRDLPHRRPDFLRMIEAVKQDKYDILVVDHRDRFGVRDVLDWGRWCSILRDHECQLWSVAQGHLTGDDLAASIIGTVESCKSSAEQVDLSWRVIGGMQILAERGEWLGGVPPYGFDVLCVGSNDVGKWKVRYDGHNKRLRIWPDGRTERYDGKGNNPPKDKHDRLFLTPSSSDRIETVRKIFEWITTEAISVRGIATRLNDLKIPPLMGQAWYHFRLFKLISNPVYRSGAPVWNKESQGRFHELAGGERKRVKWVKGQPPPNRRRDKSDHVVPNKVGQGGGLVDAAVWEAAQIKLASLQGKTRAPKSPHLWISGLAYCWKCGKRMAGWTKEGGHRTYCCSSYRTYGKHNQYGCELHQVRHDVLEHHINRYLEETGQALATVLTASNEEELPELPDQETDSRRSAYIKAFTTLWRAVQRAGKSTAGGLPKLARTYRDEVGPDQLKAVRKQLTAKLAEMDKLVEKFSALTSKLAQERANKKMEALEQVINELLSQAQPLDEVAINCREVLKNRLEAVQAAKQAGTGDSNRRKAQTLSRVVARIVCRFETTPVKGKVRFFLREITFEPLLGAQVSYGTDAADRRRCSRR